MVKFTREDEILKRGPRLASPTNTRLREEKQVDSASQTCSPGPMKRNTSVDPTERPNSYFMVPFQQPALTLVASAAAEDPGSQLTTSAIASEDQVARIKSTSTYIDKSIASSSSTAFKYIYQHSSDAPARGSMYSSDQPALVRTTGELCSPPAASINPLKTNVASPAAADPPGNLRGSDCSGLLGTSSVPGRTLGHTTASTPGEVLGHDPATSRREEDLRGRDRSRLLETVSTLGEVLGGGISAGALGEAPGGGTSAGAPEGALGGCTPTSKRNPRGSDGPSREKALAREPIS